MVYTFQASCLLKGTDQTPSTAPEDKNERFKIQVHSKEHSN